jgi:hypothetical protein
MNARKMIQASILLVATSLLSIAGAAIAQEQPLIFPIPLEVQIHGGKFDVDKGTSIVIHDRVRKGDDVLARSLSHEFVDR